MADNEIKTYGDLKQAIKSTDRKKTIKNFGGKAIDIALGQIPIIGAAKDILSLIRSAATRKDDKKTNTWLDQLDIDDQVAAIVDDTVEDRFFKFIADKISGRNDNDELEKDFNMNQELANWLSNEYNRRYVAGVPSTTNEMKKDKIKETLKAKLKQETSVTGTGASVTSGTGAGVATKYAFGKRDNKGTPSDWKEAPSIPNRKSKAMDYKELWEMNEVWDFNTGGIKAWDYGKILPEDMEVTLQKIVSNPNVTEDDLKAFRDRAKELYKDSRITRNEFNFYTNTSLDTFKEIFLETINEVYTPSLTNAEELARVEELLAQANRDNAYSVMSSYEFRIKMLRLLVALEKKYNTTLPLLKFGMMVSDYLSKYFPGFKGKFGPYNQNWKSVKDHIEQSISQKQGMNEENIEEAYVPDNIKKFAQRKGITNTVNQVARWAEKMGKRIVGGTAIGKDYSTLLLDLTYQGGEIRINTDTDEIEINDQDIIDYQSFADAVDSLSEPINENYARFRNETKTRTKPEQFHNAVKEVKKKVQEINRLFEYMNRLQSELKESEGGLKTKKYTESALQQIKEATKQLFFKSTKLK